MYVGTTNTNFITFYLGTCRIIDYICSSYGLLGASGCGKTTLLSCIVGRKKFHGGQIFVLGGKPGEIGSGVPGPRVGYMPQVRPSVTGICIIWD